MKEFASGLLPVLVPAAIGAWVAWHAAGRSMLSANVIAERAKWRDRIRLLAMDLQTAVDCGDAGAIKRLRVAFRLSLNPWDDRDREIAALLGQLVADHPSDELLERVVVRLELLLKHDWERAKAEATWRGRWRTGTPSARAAAPRAGVASLISFRARRPLDADFQEDVVL